MKFRRIWEILASSVWSASTPPGSSNTSCTVSPTSRGRSIPRSAPKSPVTSKSVGRTTILPASTLARSSRSPTSSDRSCAALRMNSTCRTCSDVSSPSRRRRSSRLSARIELRGVRNSWLMLERKRDFISSARRRWSARSSSSAYRATTPRLVSSSSPLTRTSSSCRDRRSASAPRSSRFCRCSSASGSSGRSRARSRLRRSRSADLSAGVPGGRSLRSHTVVPRGDVST